MISVSGNKGIISLKGDKELEKMFKGLPDQLNKRTMLHILKKAVKPLVSEMKSEAPKSSKTMHISAHRDFKKGAFSTKLKYHKPGELQRGIGVIALKSKQASLSIGPRIGRKSVGNNDPWYWYFIIKGTQRGISPNDFIKRAFDATIGRMESFIMNDIKKTVEDYMAKHGPKYF